MNTELQSRMVELSRDTQVPMTQSALILAGIVNGDITDPVIAKAIADAQETAKTTNDPDQWFTAFLAEAAVDGTFSGGGGGGGEPGEVTQAELDAEIAARIAGDSSLTAALNSEASARAAGDVATNAAISNEANARATADAALSTRVTALENEPGGGGGGEVTQAELDAEAATRAAADAALSAADAALSAADAALSAADAALSARVTVLEENAFTIIDTQAQFDAALTAGRSMVLRGEGTGGVISMTAEKVVGARHTTIKSDNGAVLRYGSLTSADANPRALTIRADDVTLSNFELTSSIPDISTNACYGLVFNEGVEGVTPGLWGHRMKVLDMHIHNWQRCISKDGSDLTTPHQDILIDRLYAHTWKEIGCSPNYGFHRLVMRDSRLVGKVAGVDTHTTTHNCVHGGSNWRDCLFENCIFSDTGRMGWEATTADLALPYYHERTRVVGCQSINCGSMGFSMGFVIGGVYEKCRVKTAVQVGIELAGRVAGHPSAPPPDGLHHFAQGLIESCEVDGVDFNDPCYGISIDGCRDTSIRGANRISNITSTHPSGQGACGIGVTSCERISIQGAAFDDCGHKYLYVTKGHLPNTSGHHEFHNNLFRNTIAPPAATPHVIYVDDQTCSVKNNTMYQKSGTTYTFSSVTYAPANVYADGVAVANSPPPTPGPIPVSFTGTNIIIPGP